MFKTVVLLFASLCISFVYASAQQFEPKWVGEVYLLSENADNDTIITRTEKANVQVKTTQSAGRIIAGIGNIRRKVIIKGGRSEIQVSINNPVTLIVKCRDNETDPTTFIQLIKFEEKSKERRTELAKENWLGNLSEGNMTLIPFEADTYGKSSYIITMQPQEGEFGVRIVNPNIEDEKVPVFNCFGIHREHIKDDKNSDTKTSYFYKKDGIKNPVYLTTDGRYYVYVGRDKVEYVSKDMLLEE